MHCVLRGFYIINNPFKSVNCLKGTVSISEMRKNTRNHPPINLPKPPRPLSPSHNPIFRHDYNKDNLSLEGIRNELFELRNDISRSSGTDTPMFIEWVDQILNAKIGALSYQASEVTRNVNELFSQGISADVVVAFYYRLVTICIQIRNFFTVLIAGRLKHKPRAMQHSGSNKSTQTLDGVVICRICEKPVHLDLIEEHTTKCLTIFQSESAVFQVNSDLQAIRDDFTELYLGIGWPILSEESIMFAYPVLRLQAVTDAMINTDHHKSESPEDLSSYISVIQELFLSLNNKEISAQIQAVMKLAENKKHICYAICSITDTLRKTCVDKSSNFYASAPSISIADFDFIKRISRGAYARVYLARKNKTGDIFAIKVQSKSDVLQKNQGRRILAEKDILLKFQNPYICNFYYSIVGELNFYIVMEFLPGGDLYSLLQHLGCLSEDSVKIYAYQIIKALECLHSSKIIHRDLKPDNILITSEGTLKLTDFGLSHLGILDRQMTSSGESIVTSRSLVGTPNYTAPEIILNQNHTFTVDYWSLGIIIYELIMGSPPFEAESEKDTQMKILIGQYAPLEGVTLECSDFVKKLLTHDPVMRLGYKGVDELLNHPWIANAKFDECPPFIPNLESPEDTGYFEERYTFSNEDESAILKDIEVARSNSSNSLNSSHSFESDSSRSDIAKVFESVSSHQLAAANLAEAKRVRRCSMSMPKKDSMGPIISIKSDRIASDDSFIPKKV